MTQLYVGLDVHSKRSVFSVVDAQGTTVREGAIATTPDGFRAFVAEVGLGAGTPVALETGTLAFFAARLLEELGLAPVVIDAHEVRLKASRPMQKSDRRDARELADGLRRDIYRTRVYVPPASIVALREALSRRRHFVRVQAAEIAAAKRLVRARGLGHLYHGLKSEAAWERLAAAVAGEPDLAVWLDQHRTVWRTAVAQVTALDAELATRSAPHAAPLARLQTVPGVGPIVAATTLAVLGDVRRFPSAKEVGSYVGLVPATYQSGDRSAAGRITKRGSSELRTVLCQAAQHARRAGHPFHPHFARVAAKAGYKRAIIAVAHRLARVLFAMLRDDTAFTLAKAGVEAGPFTTTTIRPYRRLTPRRRSA